MERVTEYRGGVDSLSDDDRFFVGGCFRLALSYVRSFVRSFVVFLSGNRKSPQRKKRRDRIRSLRGGGRRQLFGTRQAEVVDSHSVLESQPQRSSPFGIYSAAFGPRLFEGYGVLLALEGSTDKFEEPLPCRTSSFLGAESFAIVPGALPERIAPLPHVGLGLGGFVSVPQHVGVIRVVPLRLIFLGFFHLFRVDARAAEPPNTPRGPRGPTMTTTTVAFAIDNNNNTRQCCRC